jgi:hypothetical protein
VIQRAIVLFALSLLVPAWAAQTGSISLATPPHAAAPLQIANAFFNDTMLTVLLVNVSGRAVEQTTMGLVLGDRASVVPPVTRTGSACVATVPADGLLVVTAAHNGFDKALAYFREKGILEKAATVGLVHVRSADGSEWAYPPPRVDGRKDYPAVDRHTSAQIAVSTTTWIEAPSRGQAARRL